MIIIEENNNKVSGELKGFFAPILKVILIIACIFAIIAGAKEIIKIKDGSHSKGNKSNTGNVVEEKALSNTNIENIAPSSDGWSVNVNLETTVDEIIKELEENNGCLDTYISEENQKEYLTAFIRAELVTQYPDLRSDPDKIKNGVPPEDGEFQGCIQIHRAASDAKNGETQILTYIDYNKFEEYVGKNDSQVLNHFTLGTNDDFIVAGWERTTTNVTSNVPGVENIVDKVEYSLIEKSVPYKKVIDSYILPFDLLWALTVSGEDEEFAYNLAQLALNSKIIFTVQDNLTTSIVTKIEQYKEQEKIQKQATLKVQFKDELNEDGEPIEHTAQTNISPTIKKSDFYKTETITKTEMCSASVDITEAKTWIVDYTNSYSNNIPNNNLPIGGEPQKIDDTDYTLVDKRVPLENDEEVNNELLKFQIELCGSEENYKKQKKDDNIVAVADPQFYNKYIKTIEHTITNTTNISYNSYVQDTPGVTEKTENFTQLFDNSATAKTIIKESPTALFKMLESSPKAADMVDLVKYLLYKSEVYDNEITSLGLSIINLKDTKTVKGSSTENFIKAWENSLLWKYETQDNAPFPTGYLSVDGLNYLVYEDGSAGHNNIAYGWATFITDSGNVKANHPQYGGGYYNHVKAFKDVGIDVTTLYEGAPVNKEAANSAFLNVILDECIKYVDNYLKDNLPEYTFSQEQKDALISMRYQYGNLSNSRTGFDFATSYRNSLNEDGTINAEKLKENCSRFDYEETINDRKYANWLLFTQEKYIDRSGNEIQFGILPSAKKIHDYMSDPTHLYYYCLANGKEKEVDKHLAAGLDCGLCHSFELSQVPGTWGYRLTCCATYVSWVLVDCGYIQPEDHKHGCGSLVAVLERDKKNWIKIDNYDDLEPGDIVFMDTDGVFDRSLEHVQIHVGDEYWYNAGGNSAIHKIEPYHSDTRSQFLYAYRRN